MSSACKAIIRIQNELNEVLYLNDAHLDGGKWQKYPDNSVEINVSKEIAVAVSKDCAMEGAWGFIKYGVVDAQFIVRFCVTYGTSINYLRCTVEHKNTNSYKIDVQPFNKDGHIVEGTIFIRN